MIYKGKKFLCKNNYEDFQIGKFYKVELEAYYFKHWHLCINGRWFTTELGDQSFFPSLYTYFFNEQEERKIKLQVIDIQSRFQRKSSYYF